MGASYRRSFRHAAAAPDEIGQHCRAGYMSDRLADVIEGAAAARWLLDNEIDDRAIVALGILIDNMREVARTLKVFRRVHEQTSQTSPPNGKEAA